VRNHRGDLEFPTRP